MPYIHYSFNGTSLTARMAVIGQDITIDPAQQGSIVHYVNTDFHDCTIRMPYYANHYSTQGWLDNCGFNNVRFIFTDLKDPHAIEVYKASLAFTNCNWDQLCIFVSAKNTGGAKVIPTSTYCQHVASQTRIWGKQVCKKCGANLD